MTDALQGRRILVTRPAAQATTLAEKIAGAGGEPVLFPLLEIAPADDLVPLDEAIAHLDDYAIVVFVSPNAVDYSLPRDAERVTVNGRVQRASYDVKVGDVISIRFGAKTLTVEVLSVTESVGKDAAAAMYREVAGA